MRSAVHIDLPNPNGVAWGTFENGAILTSQEGVFNALVAPDPGNEHQALDSLKAFVRGRFDVEFHKSPDNVGLHPEIELLGTLPYEHDFSQSIGRAVVFRLHGFHDNGNLPIGDTDFTIDIGIRIGWKLDPILGADTRELSAFLVEGFPTVNIISGPGGGEIRDKVTSKIRNFFASGVALKDVPVIAEQDGTRIWVLVDLIMGEDGGLRLLVNPEQRNFLTGGGPLGPVLRDRAEKFLLDFLETP